MPESGNYNERKRDSSNLDGIQPQPPIDNICSPMDLTLDELRAFSESSSSTAAGDSQPALKPSSPLQPTLSYIPYMRQARYHARVAADYTSENMSSVQTSRPSPPLPTCSQPEGLSPAQQSTPTTSLDHTRQAITGNRDRLLQASSAIQVERCSRCFEAWDPLLPAQSRFKKPPARSAIDYVTATDLLYTQQRQHAKDADEAFAQWKEKHSHCPQKPVSSNNKSASLLSDSAQGHDLHKRGFGVERSSSQRVQIVDVAPPLPLPSHHKEDPGSWQESGGRLKRTNSTRFTTFGGDSLASQSEKRFKLSQDPEEHQQDDSFRGTGRNKHQVNEDNSQFNVDLRTLLSLRLAPQEQQHQQHDHKISSGSSIFSKLSSHRAELASPPLQSPASARDVAVLKHLPSDSDHQSGRGINAESTMFRNPTERSLDVSGKFLHDMVTFLGDTLVEKTDARQWSQFAMAHHSQSATEKRLTALIRVFASNLAARTSTSVAHDYDTRLSDHDHQAAQVLLSGTINLIRNCRRMIARYFLHNCTSAKDDGISSSDSVQDLGRHFTPTEQIDLLVHQRVSETDGDDERKIVDEDFITLLKLVQAMLVSGDEFRHLASGIRRSLYRDDMHAMVMIQNIVLKSISPSIGALWTKAAFSAKWDVLGFMRSQYNNIPPVASIVVLTGSTLYAQATTCGEYVRTNWPTTGYIFLDLLDKALAPGAEKTAWLLIGMFIPYRRSVRL
jgi:hypothetical protein